MPAFHLRNATPADNVLLAELGARTFLETFAADNTPENIAAYLAAAFGPEQQARELAEPNTRFLLIEQAGTPAGYARIKFAPAPPAVGGQRPMEIARLYARREWIGQGVGAQLMQACLQAAEQAECDLIWLDVWERNPRAIAFYQRWGFTQVGTQVFPLGDDPQTDWLMARPTVL